MKRALITGGDGFVGYWLRRELKGKGYAIWTFDIKDGEDITDYEQIRNKLDRHRPDEIYHLAAQAFVPESIHNPARTFQINTIGSANLLKAVKELGIVTKVLLAGTSEEYGAAQFGRKRVDEQVLPEPESPYAISKLAMDYLGRWYAKAFGLHVVVTRAYNHGGPGRGEMYAESSWAKQIVEIEMGRRKYLEHGNLESVRNYNDVRDIVRAYAMAIHLKPDVYNVCGDHNVRMQLILDLLTRNATKKIPTKINKALYRPSDFSFAKPSAKKFTKLTGWKPEIKLEQMLIDILEDWRERLR